MLALYNPTPKLHNELPQQTPLFHEHSTTTREADTLV